MVLGQLAVAVRMFNPIALCLALSIPFLWQGYAWLRWLVGGACVLSGGLVLFAIGRNLAVFGIFQISESPLYVLALQVLVGILGLVEVLAGLAFLFLPSVQAFFRYQRERPLTGKAREDRLSPTMPNRRRSLPRLVAAAGWGLALGCGVGVLLSAYWTYHFYSNDEFVGMSQEEKVDFVLILLAEVVAPGLMGLVAGLAVGAAPPKAGQLTVRRFAVTRGLLAAGACVIVLAVSFAIWGGLFGVRLVHELAPPGWKGAAASAGLSVVFLGPPVAVVGFVLGGAVARLIRDS
jgi:hypothetical protein